MKRLTVLREARGWSRAEAGRRAGLDGATVGKLENGRLMPAPESRTLRKLARAFGVPPTEASTLLDPASSTEPGDGTR